MKEKGQSNIRNVKRQTEITDFETVNKLWESGVLGKDTPDKLRSTISFLIGLNIILWARGEHYAVHRDTMTLSSQLQFKRNDKGLSWLVC